jgi:hypothetical protein
MTSENQHREVIPVKRATTIAVTINHADDRQ